MTKASDNEFPSVLFDEQASDVSTPATGFWRAYFKSDGIYIIDDAGVVTGPLGAGGGAGSYSSWVPALTSSGTNPTLGTGAVQTGQYVTIGDTVIGHGLIRFGTSGVSNGSGNYLVSLPVNASTNYNTTFGVLGNGFLRDETSTGTPEHFALRTNMADPDTAFLSYQGSIVGATQPWTWAAQDIISYAFHYQID